MRTLRVVVAAALGLLSISCLDQPTQPTTVVGARSMRECSPEETEEEIPCNETTQGWRDFFGLGTFYATGVPLSMAVATNVGWVRIGVAWDYAEPIEGQHDESLLATLDSTVADFTAAGVKVHLNLVGSPYWARACHEVTLHREPDEGGDTTLFVFDDDGVSDCSGTRAPTPDRYQPWANFVSYMVNRYPDVEYWSIWNEPNSQTFLRTRPPESGDPSSVYVYSTLVAYAAPIIHAAGKKVVAPETVGLFRPGTQDTAYVNWFNQFMVYEGYQTDVISVHMYALEGPNEGTSSISTMIRHLATNTYAAYSSAPIWLTEVGLPGPIHPDWLQAKQLGDVYTAMMTGLSGKTPRWNKTFQFSLGDPRTYVGQEYSLVPYVGSPYQWTRPAYDCLRRFAGYGLLASNCSDFWQWPY